MGIRGDVDALYLRYSLSLELEKKMRNFQKDGRFSGTMELTLGIFHRMISRESVFPIGIILLEL